MPIEAVIFDWGGTLTPWHTVDPLDAWRAATGDEQAAAALAAAEEAVWIRSRDEHRSATLVEVLAAANIDASDPSVARYHEWWEPHTLLDPDVPDLFRELRRRRLRIGVLSNTTWPRAEHERIFARDEVLSLIDGAVYTSEIAWTKPHPEAFRAALAGVGVAEPSRAVFVGDRPFDDIHGAKSVGMRAVWLPHSDIPEWQQGPVAALPHDDIPEWQRGAITGEPDAVIHRLAELPAVLDRWP